MPKIPLIKNAMVQMQRENLPVYSPQRLESPAESLAMFTRGVMNLANSTGNFIENTTGEIAKYKVAEQQLFDNAAEQQLKLNDYKAISEMESYAKEHPEDYANFGTRFQDICKGYAESNQKALESMSLRGRRAMQSVIESRAERNAFDVKQLQRRSFVECGIKDLNSRCDDAMALGRYEDARQFYRAAATSVGQEAPLLSREQMDIGIRYVDSREQFDLFSGYINSDGMMEVLE